LVIAVILLGVVVLSNVVARQVNLRLDLTKLKQHTLTPETATLLAGLPEKVTMTALMVGMPPKYIEDMFKEYERLSNGRVATKIVDPLVDLGYAAQFGNIISGKEQKVVVQTANARRDVDFTDDILTEDHLSNALIRVTRTGRLACFLSGHGEYKIDKEGGDGLSVFNRLLSMNGVDSLELFLGSGNGVPSTCDVLVIAGPQRPIGAEETARIDDYLKQGGDALVLIEHTLVSTPDKPLTTEQLELNPSLNELLVRWGLKVSQDIVVDLESHAAGDVGSPATNNYLSHRAIVGGLDYTFYIRPRSISIVPDRRKTLKVAPIVLTQSDEKSWGESDRLLKVVFDEAIDRPGPVPISFVVWEEKQGEEPSDTRLILFTDADFLSDAYIGAYSNAQMGLNCINWLTEADFKAFKSNTLIKVEKLELLSHQKKRVVVLLWLMPLAILAAGIGVWWSKR
jgi:ABC-type uncharacterized transport system involved in gliding motility auxiliary subunit